MGYLSGCLGAAVCQFHRFRFHRASGWRGPQSGPVAAVGDPCRGDDCGHLLSSIHRGGVSRRSLVIHRRARADHGSDRARPSELSPVARLERGDRCRGGDRSHQRSAGHAAGRFAADVCLVRGRSLPQRRIESTSALAYSLCSDHSQWSDGVCRNPRQSLGWRLLSRGRYSGDLDAG